jgi:hypothetical protein
VSDGRRGLARSSSGIAVFAGAGVLAGFLGIADDDRRWRSSLAALRFSDPGRWRQELDAPTVERITRIQRDDLERYGYEA